MKHIKNSLIILRLKKQGKNVLIILLFRMGKKFIDNISPKSPMSPVGAHE